MSIRLKLLFLLLVITLPALSLLSYRSIDSLQSMGERLIQLSEARLLERHHVYLQEKISSIAQLLALEAQLIKASLQNQVQAVEDILAKPANRPLHPIVFSEDFDADHVKTTPHERYQPDNKQADNPVFISLEVPVFLVSDSARRQNIEHLTWITPVYKRLYNNEALLSLWHYTSLDSGIHMSYPGHGGYPRTYDPRNRAWYREAMQRGDIYWSEAMVDATTGKLILTVAAPVRYPQGTIAGVTAMDIAISELLGVNISEQDWLQNAQLLILRNHAGNNKLSIHAQQHYRDADLAWHQRLETESLFASAPEKYQQVIELDGKNPSTIFELDRNNVHVLMAITPIFKGETYLALMFPREDLLASLSRAKQLIVDERDRQIWEKLLEIMVVLGVLTVSAIWISRTVTSDLQTISHTAGEIAQGALESRAHIKRKDEIGQLAGSINTMADAIETLQKEQESSYMQMLRALTRALEKKDSYTAAHSGRVANYSAKLGKRIGLDNATLALLKSAALMHDLGKIGIADVVLNKPANLNEEELKEMKLHPQHGKAIMKPLLRFKEFAHIAAWHHEHWDGSGYPDGLKGDEIPLLARIVSIADSWDAMTGDRIYRKGMTEAKAIGILEAERHRGQWDPQLLGEFIAMVKGELPNCTPGQ